jgi:prepilin-type N-terminal cleavage/methylation domain-containing protein
MSSRSRTDAARRTGGMTLIEIVVAVAILGVLAAVAVPNVAEWARHQRLKDGARSVGDLLLLARAEAIRTGRRHVVFFGPPGTADPAGTAVEAHGAWAPFIVLDDGIPTNANCAIEAGEDVDGLIPLDGVSWGISRAAHGVPTDPGAAPFNSPLPWDGATFADADGNAVPWVLFGPDGIPLTFDGSGGDCGTLSGVGGGGGTLYVTDGERDYAIVLTPIGGVRLYLWNPERGQWSS